MAVPDDGRFTTDVIDVGINSIDALLFGVKWGGSVGTGVSLEFSFPWTASDSAWFLGPNGHDYSGKNEPEAEVRYGLSWTQKVAAREALQAWANVADLTFVEVSDNSATVGDIRFAFSSATDGYWGWAYYPNSYWSSGGDIWINPDYSDEPWSVGSYDFMALLHEVGHALGLKHPFKGADVLPDDQDHRGNTVMSYTDPPRNMYPNAGWVGGEYDWLTYDIVPSSPMIFDIAVIQHLYGANYEYNSDNTTYTFSETEPFFFSIWDGGGIDTLDVSNFVEACYIDLNPGAYSSLGFPPPDNPLGLKATYDGSNNLGIAFDCVIENVGGGQGNDTVIGNSSDNSINSNGGDDWLFGDAGNDVLDGGAGADHMEGGAGNDTYFVDNAGDTVSEVDGSGNDLVKSSVTFTLGTGLEKLILTGSASTNGFGSTDDNTLIGNSAGNTLNGGAGADLMNGKGGDDTYIVDNIWDRVVEAGGNGNDTIKSSVTFTLGTGLEKLILTGNANIKGFGSSNDDTLIGNSGRNLLNGNAGADLMNGKGGNDIYIVDNIGDRVIEAGGGGNDIVKSLVSFTLENGLEKLILTGSASTNGFGSTDDNTLIGNSAGNTLNGGAGADLMNGKGGDDTYIVDNIGDRVVETGGNGNDTVKSSVTFTLGTGIEMLRLTGVNNINGFGNADDNTLTGNSGNNVLNGGVGSDAMNGKGGNDIYIVDNVGDTVSEAGGSGIDTVKSSVSFTLGADLERLFLTGNGNTTGIGNMGNNTLYDNSGDNILNGGAGDDKFYLRGGSDSIVFNDGFGKDRVFGFTLGVDVLDLRAVSGLTDFDDLTFRSTKAGHAVVDLGADEILLVGILETDLDAGDFLI